MYGSYIQFTSANILHFHQIFKGLCDPKKDMATQTEWI